MPLFRPGKPYSLRTRTSSPGSLAALATITWQAEDADGDWTASDLTSLVVNVSGLYLLQAGWGRPAPSGSSTLRVQLLVNGGLVAQFKSSQSANAEYGNCSRTLQLVAGDAITTAAQTGGTGAPDLLNCFQAVTRIGPVRWT